MALDDVAVVIPALNEADSLPLVLSAMPSVGHVIVVDNGSTDDTPGVARAGGAVVVHEPRRGYGQACQAGIREAVSRAASVVVILDADHSFDPQEIAALTAPILRDEADMVLGDRTERAEKGAITPQQRIGNRVATFLIRRITGHRYSDMGPFRAIRTQALVDMAMEDPNFGWNVEMQIKAVRHGLRVMEMPVRCRVRQAGDSKISGSVRGSVRAGWKMMRAAGRYAR
jgi:glycosyltransferase involved in cell wall biosynthesis